MDVSQLLNDLNDAQRRAVCASLTNILVLAGAGSGKTRVLVYRMAWLIQVKNISPYEVLALTFTNKAAVEMRQRCGLILGGATTGMWVGTFHGTAHRLLRQHWKEAGLPQGFQILDSQDQLRLVKKVIRALNLDEIKWPAKQAQYFINARKDEGKRPQHMIDNGDFIWRQLVQIYNVYEEHCQRLGVIDFAELLLRSLELIRDNDALREYYQQRFKHILVDEFQDTNTIQYAFLRLMLGSTGKLFAVGDDDQSIYGWRGARVENLQQLPKHFPSTEIIKLEQNYRSTSNILNMANVLIANNNKRLGKKLWTDSGEGELIDVYAAYSEIDEARYIGSRIKQWVDRGGRHDECAILYRSNIQSRVMEEEMIQRRMPYRVYGGLRFFERSEIKDALAYLRLCSNRYDDPSFERVINIPTRGIGERTVELIREYGRSHTCSLWQAAKNMIAQNILTIRAIKSVQVFIDLVDELQAVGGTVELYEKVESIVHQSGLMDYYGKNKSERGEAKQDNLQELVSAARGFYLSEKEEYENMSELDAFLSHAILESDDCQGEVWEDCVQLMTLHMSKGLEFSLVFLVGLEEGLFPHQMSMQEEGGLEEERRLAYVGITRARQQLVISYAESRRLYGKENFCLPSRFINEIPNEYTREVRPKPRVSRLEGKLLGDDSYSNFTDSTNYDNLYIGQVVMHKVFGEGTIITCEGETTNARVQVSFVSEGMKWLVLAYANLQAL